MPPLDGFTEDESDAIPIAGVRKRDLDDWLARHPQARPWLQSTGFAAAAGELSLLPDAGGALSTVLVGLGDEPRWQWAALPKLLPEGTYRLADETRTADAADAVLGWGLGLYTFDRYRSRAARRVRLVWPLATYRPHLQRTIEAVHFVRDLINTPASDMGPDELAEAARGLARSHHARHRVIVGNELLLENYPAIHAVGRASNRAPRLIDLTWGDADQPKVTLVGKGVCFDSGGLDLKTAAGMKLMKKDMGGAAIVLGLARMVMSAGLPVRLRVLIPAVENSVAGNAMRPLDIVRTRRGLTVEIGNTDAEGRVILADALAEAAAEDPALLVDVATLTGAARVALGAEVPAMFTHDDALADRLLAAAAAVGDPLWRLPLWRGYRRHLDGKAADLTNAPDTPFAGAILAALFLAEFAAPVRPWVHLDVMAWNADSRPGRPEGGEAMGMRALYALIEERFTG
jgi:Leucyl aminopeptidase